MASLSICLITRNAQPIIETFLRSVAGTGADVVVGDTGSTDATVEIARAAGADVIQVAWQDDFAAAQNQTLAEARGDWVLWLNPDEELMPVTKNGLAILLGDARSLAYAIRVRHLSSADDAHGAETWELRLFRRHPAIRYVNRLHAHMEPPLEVLAEREKMTITRCDLLVRRHAYTSVLTPEKLRWANRLLEMELADRPGQLHYLIEYGRNLLLLNDSKGHLVLADAAAIMAAVGHAPAAPISTVGSLLEYLLTVAPEQSRSHVPIALLRDLAVRWFPNTPPVIWALAKRAYQVEDFRDAASHLEKLIRCGRTDDFDRTMPFDQTIMGEPAMLNLARCYLRLGELDCAEECFTQLLTSSKYRHEAEAGVTDVRTRRAQRI